MAMWIANPAAKRALDPSDDRIKAQFCCSSTSGSEYGGHEDDELDHLINGFFEFDDLESDSADKPCRNDIHEDDDDDDDDSARTLEIVQDLINPYKKSDYQIRLGLYSKVVKLSEALAVLRPSGSGYRRAVMARLRQLGYNAGICKARWEGSGGLTAGNYEYIDIVGVGGNERYIVDLDFAAQFEVARAAAEYKRLAEALPRVMVCKSEELRQVVRIMAEAARRSLKSEGLSVPPWRKSRYMITKWLGPYRRTVNPLPSSAGAAVAAEGGDLQVKCRTIGFKAEPARTVLFN